MHRMTRQCLAAFVLTGLICQPAAAGMRCGMHIIGAGERHGAGKYEVLKKCGKPKQRLGNTWIYEKPKRAVHFNDSGRITSIE